MITVWFDMDGTLNRFYEVEGWLTAVKNYDTMPYLKAKVNLNMSTLARYLNKLQAAGYGIGIISWLAKTPSNDYDEAVTAAKLKWLHMHLPSVNWNKIYIVKHGTPKQNFMKNKKDILFDDEEKNRDAWNGKAYEPNEIIAILKALCSA